MSTKLESAAAKAAKEAKVAKNTTKPHGADGLKAEARKHLMHVASFAFTTITFVAMVCITFGADAFVRDVVFAGFNIEPKNTLAVMFKYAKYAALGVELAFWVYGVYKECKHHAHD